MLRFRSSDIHVVTLNDDLTSIDDFVEEPSCFKCCKEFLFSLGVFELRVVEFLREHADNFFCAIDGLSKHCSHGVLLLCIWVDDERFVGVWVGAEDGVGDSGFCLVKHLLLYLPPDE